MKNEDKRELREEVRRLGRKGFKISMAVNVLKKQFSETTIRRYWKVFVGEKFCDNCGEIRDNHIDYFNTGKYLVCPQRRAMQFSDKEVKE